MEALLFEIVDARAAARQITEELDLDFAYAYGDKARFRANYFYKVTGPRRGLPHHPDRRSSRSTISAAPTSVRKLAERRAGLVLVTGPDRLGQVDDARRR